MPTKILRASLADIDHQKLIVELLNEYASDPFGNGQPLPVDVRERLIDGLRNHPMTLVFLAFVDDRPAGIAVCFIGFSTFAARRLINIHDLFVRLEFRGQRLATQLLEAIEAEAEANGCCKLTLEVLENNRRAFHIYERFGFAQARYVEEAGGALFMAKKLGELRKNHS